MRVVDDEGKAVLSVSLGLVSVSMLRSCVLRARGVRVDGEAAGRRRRQRESEHRRGSGVSYSYSSAPPILLQLQLVPLRGTTIGAETSRGSETKERVYEAAALP